MPCPMRSTADGTPDAISCAESSLIKLMLRSALGFIRSRRIKARPSAASISLMCLRAALRTSAGSVRSGGAGPLTMPRRIGSISGPATSSQRNPISCCCVSRGRSFHEAMSAGRSCRASVASSPHSSSSALSVTASATPCLRGSAANASSITDFIRSSRTFCCRSQNSRTGSGCALSNAAGSPGPSASSSSSTMVSRNSLPIAASGAAISLRIESMASSRYDEA